MPYLGKLVPGMRRFLAAALNVAVPGHATGDATVVGDRCGAQRLLEFDQHNAFLVRLEISPVR